MRHRIPGDIVECGVWSGGSMLLAAHALLHFGDTSRRIWLYDTFAGVPKPEPVDARWDGVPALPTWEHHNKTGGRWGYGGTQEHVREVVCSSGYPADQFVFVEGMVEETLPATRPEVISLLRLDTDLYRSTYLNSCICTRSFQQAVFFCWMITVDTRECGSRWTSISRRLGSRYSCRGSAPVGGSR